MKYRVFFYYMEKGNLEVEANTKEEADKKAYESLERGDFGETYPYEQNDREYDTCDIEEIE